MAYSEDVANHIREALANRGDVTEKKMFGGLAFMVGGHMCCGVLGDELMVRVGPDQYEAALTMPDARVMTFTGKPMRGMVMVDAAGSAAEAKVAAWVERGLTFVATLPPK
jgi:TfoX/Sxy family transcriptional regulator of competence genes